MGISKAIKKIENDFVVPNPNSMFQEEQEMKLKNKISEYFELYKIGRLDTPPIQELNNPETFASINEDYCAMIMRIISSLDNLISRISKEQPSSTLYFENFVIYSEVLDLFTELMEDIQYFMKISSPEIYGQKIVYCTRYSQNNIVNRYNEYLEKKEIFENNLVR